jgi:selenide,water dikinase
MKSDLLRFVESGGCSSKISPLELQEILKYLPVPDDPNILVNIDAQDDAGVYKINDDLALVITVDFFPPVCNDPFEFGQIAAANAVSDIYAMGGVPVVALNIMMFPSSELPLDVYVSILEGGNDKATEAGMKIIGGHTINDTTPKYGLAVTGYVHPDRIVTNAGARPGDFLVLTKAVGTGIILAGQRLGISSETDVKEALKIMKLLNKTGAEIMNGFGTIGATDITGFGLAGHALKMAKASNVSITLNMSKVPLIGETYNLVDEGCIPGASFRNLDFVETELFLNPSLDYNLKMIAMDAQTSGGLLLCVSKENKDRLLEELHSAGLSDSAEIGYVTEKGEKLICLEV